MKYEQWGQEGAAEGQELVQELDLNTGGLVGAVTCVEGTGQLVTGTRNDESGWSPLPLAASGARKNASAAAATSVGNRLTVHTIRDTRGRVLGLGSSSVQRFGGAADGDDEGGDAGAEGWEPVVEAWTPHEGAVAGVDVAGDFGNLGGVSGVVTAGGDGCLRMFELTAGEDQDDDNQGYNDNEGYKDAPPPGGGGGAPSLDLRGQVTAHTSRATGVAATRRRAVTVGEDGIVSLVDLQRLSDAGAGGGGGGGGGEAGGVFWTGRAKGAMPLSGVTFQGESEEVFATVGCDPRGQLLVWDARAGGGGGGGSRPVARARAVLGCLRDSDAPYLCVASQPFTPEVFACGVSTGELLLWDVRTGDALHELQVQSNGNPGEGGGAWGVAFHPRSPRHLFSCSGTGVLTKWFLPPDGQAPPAVGRFGGGGGEGWAWQGARHLHALSSRSALVGVCYDEAADTVAAVSKHGTVVVAHGVPGLRL